MTRSARIARIGVLVVLVAALAATLLVRPSTPHGEPLAYTTCTASGPTLVMDVSRIPSEDTLPVRMHEEVHVSQCNDLGWLKMRWKNLTATGRLSLEAPGYCAGARGRLRRGDNFPITRERLFDDANAMFAGSLDSSLVNAALRANCPELTASVVQ